MKNYKVKSKIDFDDIEEQCHRNIGDIFNCTKERFEFLLNHGAVELVEILAVKQESPEKPGKTGRKKKEAK